MITKLSKVSLLSAVALFYTFVVLNNTTDFNSNYQFVRHVLLMDSTFPGNNGMWRAMPNPFWHKLFYFSIIGWETTTMILSWWGAFALLRRVREPAAAFNLAKRIATVALTLGLLMWLVAFLTVGAEWFLMWQSRQWNGQEAAFRMFVVLGVVLLILIQPDRDVQA